MMTDAEEVSRLRAQLTEALEALDVFNDALGEDADDDQPDDLKVVAKWGRHTNYTLTLGDFRRAREVHYRLTSSQGAVDGRGDTAHATREDGE